MKEKKTNITEILKESLVGKRVNRIYVDSTDSSYGYLKIPMDGMYNGVEDGIIEDVIVDLPDYETGSIDIIVRANKPSKDENSKIRVNISYDDFNLIEI